jgi:hypothetical protein
MDLHGRFIGFLFCLFCRRAALLSDIPAASAAVIVDDMYQAFQKNTSP